MQYHNFLRLLVVTIFVASCSPKIGYLGESRPKSEISYIYFSGEQRVSVSGMEVDEYSVSVFDSGIEVLPGNHSITLSAQVPQELCWMGGDNECPIVTRSFHCEMQAETEAGYEYEVEVRGYGNQASISMIRKDKYLRIASGHCEREVFKLF